MYMFRNIREVLFRDVNTPPLTPTPLMILRQHVQHVKDAKKSNPIPPFRKASFLKFATLPRDRTWHISKLTTLPRAPYQPHAKNIKEIVLKFGPRYCLCWAGQPQPARGQDCTAALPQKTGVSKQECWKKAAQNWVGLDGTGWAGEPIEQLQTLGWIAPKVCKRNQIK